MLVACDLEATIEEMGHCVIGIAPDTEAAFELATQDPDLALVDCNLRDGETGPSIGKALCDRGIAVIFVTGNPRALGDGIRATLGVYTKPMDHTALTALISYAQQMLDGERGVSIPAGLYTFEDPYPDA